MSESSLIITPPQPPADPAWEPVRQWIQEANRFECNKIVAQVMTGLELMALQKRFDIKRGKGPKKDCHSGSTYWNQLVERELSIPYRTAHRWMHMARVVLKRMADIPLPQPVCAALAHAPSTWSPDQMHQITKSFAELSRGRTQRELLPRTLRPPKVLKAPTLSAAAAVFLMRPSEVPPAPTVTKSTPAVQLMTEYSQSMPNEAVMIQEMERLENVLHLFRAWLMTELGQRDIAHFRARLAELRDAA